MFGIWKGGISPIIQNVKDNMGIGTWGKGKFHLDIPNDIQNIKENMGIGNWKFPHIGNMFDRYKWALLLAIIIGIILVLLPTLVNYKKVLK